MKGKRVRETFKWYLGANGGGWPLLCCTLADAQFKAGDAVRVTVSRLPRPNKGRRK
jgi:hypothetical protein